MTRSRSPPHAHSSCSDDFRAAPAPSCERPPLVWGFPSSRHLDPLEGGTVTYLVHCPRVCPSGGSHGLRGAPGCIRPVQGPWALSVRMAHRGGPDLDLRVKAVAPWGTVHGSCARIVGADSGRPRFGQVPKNGAAGGVGRGVCTPAGGAPQGRGLAFGEKSERAERAGRRVRLPRSRSGSGARPSGPLGEGAAPGPESSRDGHAAAPACSPSLRGA